MSIETIQSRAVTLSRPFETFSKWGKWTVYSVVLGLCTCVGAAIYWRIQTNWKKSDALRLKEQQKDRDTLSVWKILANEIRDRTTCDELKTLSQDQTLEKLRQFSSWFEKKKTALLKIEHLNLQEQSIVSLPVEIGQLVNLRTFQLEGNRLTELPAWIGSLQNLRSLSLDRNQIKTLPYFFKQLTKLEWFHMEHNQLAYLPGWIDELTQLKRIFLSGNQLTSLPESLSKLSQLERIDIKDNRFVGQPQVVAQLITNRVYVVI